MNGGVELPEDSCPKCGAAFDRHSQVTRQGDLPATPATPKQGDLSLCVHCAAVLAFDGSLRLVVAPAGAIDRLDAQTRQMLFRARAAILSVVALPKGK